MAKTQLALVVTGPAKFECRADVPQPVMGTGEVLVRVANVALNPVDNKATELSPTVGAIVGCDFSGTVHRVGELVPSIKALAPGDTVCGIVLRSADRPHNGAFAEWVVADPHFLLKVPPTMSPEEAASLGIGLATCGLALYHELRLPRPSAPTTVRSLVLVYGASTATGTLALQLLRLSGLVPIAVCSAKNFELAKSRGAHITFDYHDQGCGKAVRELTGDSIECAVDCITTSESMRICYEAIGSKGGRYLALDQFPLRQHIRRTVKPRWILTNTISGQPVDWKGAYKRGAKPHDREFAVSWFQECQKLLNDQKIQPHPLKVLHGGLDEVRRGLGELKQGRVSAQKIVCTLMS